jgi:scyllo-inositol 2-dehydrogenase (NADP+)
MSTPTFGIVIIGFGGMGHYHFTMLKDMPGLQCLGTYDIKPERQDFAIEQGLKAYPSLKAVLADPDVHIILIATPNHLHKEIAIQAMRAGKHVICEKPVCLNSAELKAILDVATETGRMFQVHQNRRWDEDFLVVKKLYDDKMIGEVFHIETRVQGSRGIPGDWRRMADQGGGMMLDWGVHLLDRICCLVEGRITQVFCKLNFPTGEAVDEGFHVFLTFDHGKTVMVEVGTRNFLSLPLWYVSGTKGTAIIEGWDLSGKIMKLESFEDMDAKPVVAGAGLTKTMAPRGETTTTIEALPRVKADARDFYRNVKAVVEGKAEPVIRNSEVMRVMKLMEACFASHKSGQVVRFE